MSGSLFNPDGIDDPTIPRLPRRRVDAAGPVVPKVGPAVAGPAVPPPAFQPLDDAAIAGRAARPAAPTVSPAAAAGAQGTAAQGSRLMRASPLDATGSGNRLLGLAAALLDLLVSLQHAAAPPDVEALQRAAEAAIRTFEERALAAKLPIEQVSAARYALCCAIDEAVLRTPWGGTSVWSARSLLLIFQNETWGGERFFQILDLLRKQPEKNADALELFAILLALGFEGRYGVVKDGAYGLDSLRHDLYRTLRPLRGDSREELSRRWRPVAVRRRVATYVPLWMTAAFTAVVLVIAFMGFSWHLDTEKERIMEQILALGRTSAASVR
ncbi:type IVB secretion system protein IcmH/DotU [Azospirillum sp. ST 5-10]|uniref:type IVB secretion system protein IcmH/DotU n=1 Tax=unclassified Azospirillum TaxID=2630922 RepID=UPI003F4A39C4